LETHRLSDNKITVNVGGNFDGFIKLLSGMKVINLDIRQRSLEDIFMNYYGHNEGHHE